MRKDNVSFCKAEIALAPAVLTASAVGLAIDCIDASAIGFKVLVGAFTGSGSVNLKLEHSSDNVTFVDVPADDQIGTFTEILAANASSTQQVGYKGLLRYARVVPTVAGTVSAAMSVLLDKGGNSFIVPTL